MRSRGLTGLENYSSGVELIKEANKNKGPTSDPLFLRPVVYL